MKYFYLSLMLVAACVLSGCGYTTGSLISSRFQTIYVENFENKINYLNQDKRELYIPQLETKTRDAIIDRFLFDGSLKITEQDNSDLVLRGQVIAVSHDDLRLTSAEDVKEYRIILTMALTLWDPVNEKVVWTESSFSGEATYYTTGPLAKTEEQALQDALTDLGRRVVARTVEDW